MEEVVIEAFIDSVQSVTGTSDPISGMTDGSSVLSCDGIADKRVFIMRGGFKLPQVTGFGSYYTKFIVDNLITFSSPLVAGEHLYIKTIPVYE